MYDNRLHRAKDWDAHCRMVGALDALQSVIDLDKVMSFKREVLRQESEREE